MDKREEFNKYLKSCKRLDSGRFCLILNLIERRNNSFHYKEKGRNEMKEVEGVLLVPRVGGKAAHYEISYNDSLKYFISKYGRKELLKYGRNIEEIIEIAFFKQWSDFSVDNINKLIRSFENNFSYRHNYLIELSKEFKQASTLYKDNKELLKSAVFMTLDNVISNCDKNNFNTEQLKIIKEIINTANEDTLLNSDLEEIDKKLDTVFSY